MLVGELWLTDPEPVLHATIRSSSWHQLPTPLNLKLPTISPAQMLLKKKKMKVALISLLLLVLLGLKNPVRMNFLKQCFSNLSVHSHHQGFMQNYRFSFIGVGAGGSGPLRGDASGGSGTTLWAARLWHLLLLPPHSSPWLCFSAFCGAASGNQPSSAVFAWRHRPPPASATSTLGSWAGCVCISIASAPKAYSWGPTVWGPVTITSLREKKRCCWDGSEIGEGVRA